MKRAVVAFAVMACASLTALAADDAGEKRVTDQQFVQIASASGLAEVNLATLAKTQAKSDDVKKFAQHMIEDHTKMNKELTALADKLSIPPAATQDARHQQAATRIGALSGAKFDHAFMKQMVADHQEAVALFRSESEHGQNKDLKALAKKALPQLEKHLKMAQECCKKCEEAAKDKSEK